MVEREADRTEYKVDLILHTKANMDSTTLAPRVAHRAGVDVNELEVLPNKIRLTVHQDRLDDLASLDSVNRIEEVRPKRVYNDQARGILQADALFTSTGYQGANQTICVADTGFDQGEDSSTNIHPAFVGRIPSLAKAWDTSDFKDRDGHGTHVCGSVCGNGIYRDSIHGKHISVKGTAPAAKLMVQSLSWYSDADKQWEFGTPSDLAKDLFTYPYEKEIRIHNDSWGTEWDEHAGQLGYEADATAIDSFVGNHQDFVVLIAAGNDAKKKNHGASQIGANAAAKNCITVGATGTTRPNDGNRYIADVPASSRKTDTAITDTAIFSSRGPTRPPLESQSRATTGRIKPDVVAPGVAILSAASRAVAKDADVRTEYGPSNDEDWLFMSGTSMATPLVAGCVALLREALHEHGKKKNPAQLWSKLY